jgi:hypothetical protein
MHVDMFRFFHPTLIARSFKRLLPRDLVGKVHLERSSALMYFLAADAACKYFEVDVLDVDPDKTAGKHARRQLELEFAKLVSLKSIHGTVRQVTRLGQVDTGGTEPEKRISSNFLTVPVKKASRQSEPMYFPNRPSDSPLLNLGYAATGKKWGIEKHPSWYESFSNLLDHLPANTPLTDLAIFVCRNSRIDKQENSIVHALSQSLSERFSEEVCDWWDLRISKEKTFFSSPQSLFSDSYQCWEDEYVDNTLAGTSDYHKMKKEDLIERILHLESLLTKNSITY